MQTYEVVKVISAHVGEIALYYVFALVTSLFIIGPLHRLVFWLAEREKRRKDPAYPVLLPTKCFIAPMFLGLVEQVLYITTIIIGKAEFIAVWLAFKVVGLWKIDERNEHRVWFNMFTSGTALSLVNAFIWSLIIMAKFF